MNPATLAPAKEKTAVALPGNTTALRNTQQANGTAQPRELASAHEGSSALRSRTSKALSSKSTATEAQIVKLIELLEIAPRHTHELRRLGISHPAGRIQDLEAMGYVISVDRVTTVDENGFTHKGVARYSIVSRPEPASQHELALEGVDGGGSHE